LFDGYVFLFGNQAERLLALTTNRICRVLPVPQQDELRQDLLQVRHVITSGLPLTVESRLAPGQRVRIRKGLLHGIEGNIIRREGIDRLLIAVEFMARGVSVEINDFAVEPVSVPALHLPNSGRAVSSINGASAFA
jgi:transcriptional antiterminator RfaH